MIDIINFKLINKNTLIGTFSIRVPKWGGFIIQECSYFEKGNQRWISFPSRPYEKDGVKKYFHFNRFEDPKMMVKFQESVIKAIDELIEKNKNSPKEPQEKEEPKQIDFPF